MGNKKKIYFDNAATSHPKPEIVYKTVTKVLKIGGSAGRGHHYFSKYAYDIVFSTREKNSRIFWYKKFC